MIKLRAFGPLGTGVLFLVIGLATALGCSSTPPATSVKSTSPKKVSSAPPFDPCKESGPVPRKYYGLLKDAKCEQDMFLTMAKVAGDLGVECGYCHVQDPKDAKRFDFPQMSDKKQIALFMGHEFMSGLKRADGAEMRCKSCHVDKSGKPAAKFLGTPRDVVWTTEWMNLVMTNRFVHSDGTKVKCKDCHAGNLGTDKYQKSVILHSEQMTLPGVPPFQKFLTNGVPPGAPDPYAHPPGASPGPH